METWRSQKTFNGDIVWEYHPHRSDVFEIGETVQHNTWRMLPDFPVVDMKCHGPMPQASNACFLFQAAAPGAPSIPISEKAFRSMSSNSLIT